MQVDGKTAQKKTQLFFPPTFSFTEEHVLHVAVKTDKTQIFHQSQCIVLRHFKLLEHVKLYKIGFRWLLVDGNKDLHCVCGSVLLGFMGVLLMGPCHLSKQAYKLSHGLPQSLLFTKLWDLFDFLRNKIELRGKKKVFYCEMLWFKS